MDEATDLKSQVELGFAKYGSIDNWPTFTLGHRDVPMCKCGCRRTKHAYQSDQLGACTGCTKCTTFTAARRER